MGDNTIVAAHLGKANLLDSSQTNASNLQKSAHAELREENQLLPNWHLEVSSEALGCKFGLCGLKFVFCFVVYFAVIHFYCEIS